MKKKAVVKKAKTEARKPEPPEIVSGHYAAAEHMVQRSMISPDAMAIGRCLLAIADAINDLVDPDVRHNLSDMIADGLEELLPIVEDVRGQRYLAVTGRIDTCAQ